VRAFPIRWRTAAALIAALLPLAILPGPARAQDASAATLRTITNTAEAHWEAHHNARAVRSNTVSFDVVRPTATIRAFAAVPSGGNELTLRAPLCGAAAARGAATAFAPDPGSEPVTSDAGSIMTVAQVVPVSKLQAGRMLYFEVSAPAANRNRAAIDELEVVVTSSDGDNERLTIFETAPDSGVFAGQIATRRTAASPVLGDCTLTFGSQSRITIDAMMSGGTRAMAKTQVDGLADPFGVVFDSETGAPINGARVTLIDDATGQPASVLAEDGITAWPSSVVSGSVVTDAAGRATALQPGEYVFPLAALGRYRLVVDPPAPYTAPSQASRSDLARLTRSDRSSFAILDASFGGVFTLVDPTPVQVDIPVDRPADAVLVTMSASRERVSPGDLVVFALALRNPSADRARRDLVLSTTPVSGLRMRLDSIRINGAKIDKDQIIISNDGRSLTLRLGDLAAGQALRITYAMVVRPDAAIGRIAPEVRLTDSLGRTSRASVPLDIERSGIADRMTIIGRLTLGGCRVPERARQPLAGVRVMLEDGSFALTDADGRYHFEGVVPGTHVVQIARQSLPEGVQLVDCHRSTRNAGSAASRFAIGGGGQLVVADFHAVAAPGAAAVAPAASAPAAAPQANGQTVGDAALASAPARPAAEAAASETDWLALGDGPDGFLAPSEDANPRAPAIRVALRHRRGQTVELLVDGKPVDPLTFEGTRSPERGKFAVSLWRGVPLLNEKTVLEARIINSFGEVSQSFRREVFFTRFPAKVQLVPELSNLIADGRTRPVVAVRVLDRNNRPLREGIAGSFTLNAPFESADQIDRQQLNQLTGMAPMASRWVVEGNDGIARIELAPTMVSGALRLEFLLGDNQITRRLEIEAWVEPGEVEWTLVGLAEGTLGARSVADNMERSGQFDSDLGENARLAFYAKGRVLGKYLLTLAYDSAKQRSDQRVLGAIDPLAYYTVFADASARRFDAASQEKLYVRIETATFYAIYGDFQTAFNQTRLANYNRTATGVKGEANFGAVRAQGFAAEISSRFQRQEIQGQGISGPYTLRNRRILANSERVTIETRDRFRSELVLSTRTLVRFVDYDVDLLAGTIRFAQPVLSRDDNLNPQFIVIEYESDGDGDAQWNAGLRADWTSADGAIRLGASAISDAGSAAGAAAGDQRTDIAAIDLLARLGQSTEVRAELGLSRRNGEMASGWLVEAQHQTGKLDLLAYAREVEAEYGLGQQNGAELGRRKFGIDARVLITEHLSVVASGWQDQSLVNPARRQAAQGLVTLTRQRTDLRLGLTHFNDRLADGSRAVSTVLEAGATQRLLDNRLEVAATTAIALDKAESVDLPARHRLDVRYAITRDVRLVGTYEIAEGDTVSARQARGGIEVAPWRGGRATASLGQDSIAELGNRSFAAFGLAQTLQVTPTLTIDATIDSNRTLGGAPDPGQVINPLQPVASGGQLTGAGLFEDFTALTAGAAWRKDRWSMTARGEYRDGETAERMGLTFGAIRQLGEGSMVGSGGTWTRAETPDGAVTEIFDASIAVAHRPDASPLALLGRLEFRSDRVANGVAGEAAGAGRSALLIDGDASSRRAIASLSANWSPRGQRVADDGEWEEVRRDEYALFVGLRHNLDGFEDMQLSATSALVGLDARFGLGERFEIGATGTVRSNLSDGMTSFAYGPVVGFVPTGGVLLTVGYNLAGFRDADFGAARSTQQGMFAAVRMKFDTSTFGFLGLGGRSR